MGTFVDYDGASQYGQGMGGQMYPRKKKEVPINDQKKKKPNKHAFTKNILMRFGGDKPSPQKKSLKQAPPFASLVGAGGGYNHQKS